MKYIQLLLVSLLFSSCSVTSRYYQILELEETSEKTEAEIFENDQCKITFDFWGKGGKTDFVFENTSSEYIEFHLDSSFVLLNGFVFDLFENREYQKATSFSSSIAQSAAVSDKVNRNSQNIWGLSTQARAGVSSSTSSGFTNETGQSEREKPTRIIPPGGRILVEGVQLLSSSLQYCDLARFPSKKTSKEESQKRFNVATTPLKLSIIVCYSNSSGDIGSKLQFDFFIKQVSNLEEDEALEFNLTDECGETLFPAERRFKQTPSNSFYRRYKVTSSY